MTANQGSSQLACFLLLIALVGWTTSPLFGAQQQQRERRVNQPAPAPPVTSASPVQETTATSAAAPKTLEELRARILEVLRRPELAPAQMSIKVASLDSGRTLFEENAGKLMLPCPGYTCAEFDQPECIRRIPLERVVAAIERQLKVTSDK